MTKPTKRQKEIMGWWPKGHMPPYGYCAWHEWAEAQPRTAQQGMPI